MGHRGLGVWAARVSAVKHRAEGCGRQGWAGGGGPWGEGVPEDFAALPSPQGAEDGRALRVEDSRERGLVILHVKRGQKACAGATPP